MTVTSSAPPLDLFTRHYGDWKDQESKWRKEHINWVSTKWQSAISLVLSSLLSTCSAGFPDSSVDIQLPLTWVDEMASKGRMTGSLVSAFRGCQEDGHLGEKLSDKSVGKPALISDQIMQKLNTGPGNSICWQLQCLSSPQSSFFLPVVLEVLSVMLLCKMQTSKIPFPVY